MKKKSFILIGGFGILLIILFLVYCFFPLFLFKEKKELPGRVYIEDRNGIIITDKANEYGYKKLIDIEFDSEFVNALLAIEDKNYYNHFGINIFSKLRAIRSNLRAGEIVGGASTITEQFIKNKYFINSKRTYLQKAREAVLAFYYSLPYVLNEFGFNNKRQFNKEKVLDYYLQNVYFGNNIYGVGAALEVYFKKDRLSDLTHEEIVLLISLLHNPSFNSLKDQTFTDYFNRSKERLGYDFDREIFELDKKIVLDAFPFITQNISPDENNRVTVDAKLQAFAEKVVNDTLNDLKHKNVTNAAVFAINPRNEEVLIYMGSRDFYSKEIDGQVNVLKSLRQPGSTMKPFLYLLALEEGAGVNSLLLDIESQYESFQENTVYMSENYTLKEYGLVRFKKALGNSFNNSSVRLARELGLQKVYDYYKKYGFDLKGSPEYYGYSLVLGNPSISLEDLVKSYIKLTDFSDPNKFLLYKILSDPDNRDISFGVNSILNTSIFQAVKTGTSSHFRDNLIVSYHPDLVIGIWVGNNDNSSMIGVTGISGAGYIWHQIIEEAIRLGYIKERKIDIPIGVSEKNYCLIEPCFRKEINYDKEEIEYFSRILNGKYSDKDVFGKLIESEKEYLRILGFDIK